LRINVAGADVSTADLRGSRAGKLSRAEAERSDDLTRIDDIKEGSTTGRFSRTRHLISWAVSTVAALCAVLALAPRSGQTATGADPNAGVVRISLVAGGDVMFGRLKGRKLRPFGYDDPFRLVKPLLSGNDLVMLNLETPITSGVHYYRRKSSLLFRAKPKAARIIKKAGFNLVVTANNHCHDQKDKGLEETIDYLKRQGLAWAGTGRTSKEAWKPYIFEKKGVTVGVLALTRLNNYNFPAQKSNYAHLIRQRVRKDLPPKVAKLAKKVDFTVVVLHWGVEYKHYVIARERRLIRLLEKAGCDLFIGHHPHVLRGIQKHGDMVAFYSLGNFLFDGARGRTAEAGLARAVFEKRGSTRRLAKAELIPLILNGPGRIPRPATGSVAKRINRKVARYSRAFRKTTKLRVRQDRLEVVLR
jgi:poly-gamma-glutamate synthesis protein (capsule biosynthesis protein)